MRHNGIWTSADHILFNSLDKMNVYCLDPLVAGASQDDDPVYINSDFNDFSRKDKFDSDLWNNDERFSSDEVAACLTFNSRLNVNIASPLQEIYEPRQKVTRFLSLDICNLKETTLYECEWLQELFGQTKFTLEQVSSDAVLNPNDNLVIFLQRPYWSVQLEWLEKLRRSGYTFKIIHSSDEVSNDPIDFYSWPNVKGVIRFYPRPTNNPNTLTIPLGYHWKLCAKNIPLEERLYSWSFTGTNWKERSSQLEPLKTIDQHFLSFFPDWNDPGQLTKDQYIKLLQNTIFVPCPEGNNVETYRLYEALECGCIPVFTKLPEVLKDSMIPFLKTETWDDVAELIQYFIKNPVQMNQYQTSILSAWNKYKDRLGLSIKKWLLL